VKAVYAPVEALDSELPWRRGQPNLRIRLLNGHDFTDLEAVGIEWSLMGGEDELARGELRVKAPPHTVATLEVPTDAGARSGGRTGFHTEHLGPMLAEMQSLPRSLPGAKW